MCWTFVALAIGNLCIVSINTAALGEFEPEYFRSDPRTNQNSEKSNFPKDSRIENICNHFYLLFQIHYSLIR